MPSKKGAHKTAATQKPKTCAEGHKLRPPRPGKPATACEVCDRRNAKSGNQRKKNK